MTNCSICNKDFEWYGNNAQPVNNGVCCDDCNVMVITRRLFDMEMNKGEDIVFQIKALEKGFKSYVDPSIFVGHEKTFIMR